MVYQFRNKKTGKIIDVVMSMKDYKHYRGQNNDDDNWERIYDMPQVNIGNASVVDPFDNKSPYLPFILPVLLTNDLLSNGSTTLALPMLTCGIS